MERFFNTAGPVRADKHYCLSPLSRLNLGEILQLIDQEKYFPGWGYADFGSATVTGRVYLTSRGLSPVSGSLRS